LKFTNGFWLMKEGYNLSHPHNIRDVRVSKQNDCVTLYLPTKRIEHRGDTLNLPSLTLEIRSNQADVFEFRLWHHKGKIDNQPKFNLCGDDNHLEVINEMGHLLLKSGDHQLLIKKEPMNISFMRGEKVLTRIDQKGLAWITDQHNKSYIRGQLDLGVGEYIYGLGERFTPFVKNGQVIDIWNEDGGTSSEQSYKNIPFHLSNFGYGVFVNHPEKVSYEIGIEAVSKTQFSVEGEALNFFLIGGDDVKDVLTNYTKLTGVPALPPAWSYGLWLSTSFTTNYDEATVNYFVDEMKARDIPLSVFHFDCFWMKEFEWTNFTWDEEVFPDPVGMLKRLKEKGLKICVWINPYIAEKANAFDEAAEKGYLIKNLDGTTWQWDLWQAGMGIVDFTHPEAREWYKDKLRELLDMGVDAFKTDFGERIPTDVKYYDGSDPMKMHNYYTYLYNELVFELLKEEKGEDEAVLFARSATTGGQKFPVHWGGDCDATYASMAESLRGGLSLATSGFGYWSHDIGGFENKAPADLFKRWTAFGLLSTHSRLHGSTSYRVPWEYDDEAVQVTSFFTRLKHRLMPYLYQQSVNNNKTGVPVMRPMILEFNKDLNTHVLDRQYMLGDSILVAPILNSNGEGSYYLPEGKWTHLISEKVIEGGQWYSEIYDYFSLPLFVRPNSILPLGNETESSQYEFEKMLTFNVYEFENGISKTCEIVTNNGQPAGSIEISRTDDAYKITSTIKYQHNVIFKNLSIVDTTQAGIKTGDNQVEISLEGPKTFELFVN